MPDNRLTIVAGAVEEAMGNADLVCCVLGHVLAGIDECNARALARAASHWTRVSRAHWDACQSANGAWEALTRRHFGGGLTLLVPNDPRANFFALCRKAQNDHMGLPIFMRFGVIDQDSLAQVMLDHDPITANHRDLLNDWRVKGWRIRYRIMARHVLRLLTWHPHGKYAPYDVKGMVAYFLGCSDIGALFANREHKMATFLYPNAVTDWHLLWDGDYRKVLSARKYLTAVRKVGELLALFVTECA